MNIYKKLSCIRIDDLATSYGNIGGAAWAEVLETDLILINLLDSSTSDRALFDYILETLETNRSLSVEQVGYLQLFLRKLYVQEFGESFCLDEFDDRMRRDRVRQALEGK